MKLVAVNLLVLLVLLAGAEGVMRQIVTWNPGYYTGIEMRDGCIEYPYGRVCLNSDGYPDREFDEMPEKPVVGYFGDSICFGVGAGMGYRLSDLLAAAYPRFDHRNYCYIGDAPLVDQTLERMLNLAEEVDRFVLLLNLNDIGPLVDEMPPASAAGKDETAVARATGGDVGDTARPAGLDWLPRLKSAVYPFDQYLRGRSYLYNYLRTAAKNWLTVRGIEANGYWAAELHPDSSRDLIDEAARRINRLHAELESRGREFLLLVFPYEMQVSADAARTYRDLGIRWQPGFEDGLTQRYLLDTLDPEVRRFDLAAAFEGKRDSAKAGDYFVHDRGDKIDWNHPNRAGHRAVFEYLLAHDAFGDR